MARDVAGKRRRWNFFVGSIPERVKLICGVIDVFYAVDVLNWWAKDEARKHNAYTVFWFVLFHILPDSQFAKFLTSAVTDVCILCFTSIFECDLHNKESNSVKVYTIVFICCEDMIFDFIRHSHSECVDTSSN